MEEVIFRKNRVEDGKVVSTDETFAIRAGLVVSAIGYEAELIDGIPYSDGRIANIDGEIEGANLYVVGWAKRGPSGVIGTNKSDAAAVMEKLVSNLKSPKANFDFAEFIAARGVVHLSQANWERLNAAEISAGEPIGKPRVKFTNRKEMLGFAG